MGMGLGIGLAWLLGLACQLQERSLWPVAHYQIGVALGFGLGLGLAVGAWVLRRRIGRRAVRRGLRVVCCAMALLASALLAWGSTGWRAQARMASVWPAELARSDVMADLAIEGLPQVQTQDQAQARVPGWRVQARVLRWHGLAHPMPPDAAWPDRLMLTLPEWPEPPRAGQHWRVTLRLHGPDGLANPGGADGMLGLFSQGVRAVGRARPDAVRLPDPPSWRAQDAVDRLRQRIRDEVAGVLATGSPQAARNAGILAGLSVGDQAAIAPADWEVLRRTGIAHLVSISGTHVAMLGWLCAWLVRRAWPLSRWLAYRVPTPWAAQAVGCAAAAGYAWLAGWGVPAQRTVWMMVCMALLSGHGRRWPWPLVCLVAAVGVTVFDPWALGQPGFWLSFVAVGVLMLSGAGTGRHPGADPFDADRAVPAQAAEETPRVARWRQAGGAAMGELWRTQRLVGLALTPLALVCFQQVSVVGTGVNLVAVPVFTALITPLALLGAVWPGAWVLASHGLDAVFVLLSWAADTPVAVWEAPLWPGWLVGMVLLAACALAMPGAWRWKALALPCLLPMLWLPRAWHVLPGPAPGAFQVLAADVGQGSAVWVRTARHTLLFDTGGRLPSGADQGARVLLPMARALGVRQLDMLALSHEDMDHVGGAKSVLQGLPVASLVASLPMGHPLRTLAVGARQAQCRAGAQWDWDGVRLTWLHPAAEALPTDRQRAGNPQSCVLKVSTADGRSALLTGDIEAAQEAALVRDQAEALRSTVLLVPHHGSRTSSTHDFLQAVSPRLAVMQVGVRNAYGHPAPKVVARYAAMGLPLLGTPACGAFIWSSDAPLVTQDGTPLVDALCWRERTRRYWRG